MSYFLAPSNIDVRRAEKGGWKKRGIKGRSCGSFPYGGGVSMADIVRGSTHLKIFHSRGTTRAQDVGGNTIKEKKDT